LCSRGATKDISQPQGGWYGAKLCPEGTAESAGFQRPFRTQLIYRGYPATTWLANFRRRFATKGWFQQSETVSLFRKDAGKKNGAACYIDFWTVFCFHVAQCLVSMRQNPKQTFSFL